MDAPVRHPAFHMPFAARTNPHLEQARQHVKQWAHRVGLLAPEYTTAWPERWSERKFDEADFPLWTAMTHPDAGADELNLVTDWHVALWFVDDLFLPLFRQHNDHRTARRQVRRLLQFLPVDALPRPHLVPRNPVERAFADLWPKTAPTMTPGWRMRFRGDIDRFLHGVLWELDHIEQEGRPGTAVRKGIVDPIEFVHVRREFGGLPMTSTLMEHGLGEIPDGIHRLRPFQSALHAFADIISLHNDIVSYDREVAEGTVDNNGVEVLRKALNCDRQRAVDLLNAQLTARVNTLQHTVDTEMPRALEAEDLPGPLPPWIAAYLEALKTATAGSYAWHTQTGRFRKPPLRARIPQGPTGLGTSAAHPTRPATATRPGH
ncbi:terpene synthase family protein [Actinomadura fibrosa]|uniref:Terpene synthase n=1 Tax=Actinomadura fibrosa TaxID=111802 RepID=A0ABW2XPE9_9ACTN|nr:terpene synthase [Actinomadura fibrosa]